MNANEITVTIDIDIAAYDLAENATDAEIVAAFVADADEFTFAVVTVDRTPIAYAPHLTTLVITADADTLDAYADAYDAEFDAR